MTIMKKLLLLIVSVLCGSTLYAQGFIYTTDGKMYFTEVKNLDKDFVNVNIGDYNKLIPKSEIVLVEYMEDGIEIFQKEKIDSIEPHAFDGNYAKFLAQGQKVYVPVASTTIAVRWGAKRLRELLLAEGYWKLVGCAEEADFILTYKFNEDGRDHAYLFIYDRNDEAILQSPRVGAKDFVPAHAGEESAEKLYKRFLVNGLHKGDEGWRCIWKQGWNCLWEGKHPRWDNKDSRGL